MKTKFIKNSMQMMVMLLAFLILLTMQKLVAQVCTDPANVIYGLTGSGEIRAVTVSTGAVGAAITPAYTGNAPDLANAIGYSVLNGKFYYFKRNALNAPQEFVSFDPAFNTITVLASSPSTSLINLGCMTPDGRGYYCIDASGTLYYYRVSSNAWVTICTAVKDNYGTTLSYIISSGGVPSASSRIYGDIAFDGSGNMWILISGPATFGLYKLPANAPTANRASLTIYEMMAPTTATPASQSIGGVAFNATGQMLISTNAGHNKLYRIENNYSITFVSSMGVDGIGTDLTSCNFPMYVLPITWTDFSVTSKNGKAFLSWTVTGKEDNTAFEIQHSIDGDSWESVGFMVSNKRESGAGQYTFTYDGLITGKHYYRLANVDRTGMKRYSATRILSVSNGAGINIWPNPAENEIRIQTSFDKDFTNAKLLVYDQAGRIVKERTLTKGKQTIDIKSLSSGTYFLRIQLADGETLNQRFIKSQL